MHALHRAPELCESQDGRLGSPSLIVLTVSNTELETSSASTAQELCGSRGGCPMLPVPNSPYGLCGRKATLHSTKSDFLISGQVGGGGGWGGGGGRGVVQ